jgi:hypothetical protein
MAAPSRNRTRQCQHHYPIRGAMRRIHRIAGYRVVAGTSDARLTMRSASP